MENNIDWHETLAEIKKGLPHVAYVLVYVITTLSIIIGLRLLYFGLETPFQAIFWIRILAILGAFETGFFPLRLFLRVYHFLDARS